MKLFSNRKSVRPQQVALHRARFTRRLCSGTAKCPADAWRQAALLHSCKHAVQVLYSFCQDILASKSTTLKDDTSALTAAQQIREGTERQRLALQFRVAYKGLLHHCVLDHEQGSNASG